MERRGTDSDDDESIARLALVERVEAQKEARTQPYLCLARISRLFLSRHTWLPVRIRQLLNEEGHGPTVTTTNRLHVSPLSNESKRREDFSRIPIPGSLTIRKLTCLANSANLSVQEQKRGGWVHTDSDDDESIARLALVKRVEA